MQITKSIFCGIGGIVIGVLFGYALWFCANIFMGAGHGTYVPAKLFFPYTMASTHWTREITGDAILAGYAVYSVYGAALGFSFLTSYRRRVAVAILVLHGLAIAVCLSIVDSSF